MLTAKQLIILSLGCAIIGTLFLFLGAYDYQLGRISKAQIFVLPAVLDIAAVVFMFVASRKI